MDLLSLHNYDVYVAENGEQALEIAQTNSPDLILLDILMPEMNGFEVCEHLKRDATTCDIPIIFISALGKTQDKVLSAPITPNGGKRSIYACT